MRKVAILSILILLVCAVPVLAQDTTRVAVPFEFQVGNVTLPAGDYMVNSPTDNTLIIRDIGNTNPPVHVLIREIAADKAPRPNTIDVGHILMFQMVNGKHVLTTVKTPQMTHAHELLKVD